MYRSIGVLASLAMTAAMFVGASSAHAATGDAITCIFRGETGYLSNPLPNLDQPGSITPPVIGSPLTGTYTFTTRANCAAIDQASRLVMLPATSSGTNTTITTAGSYANFVCGTGTAHSQVGQTTIDPDPLGIASVTNAGYDIVFAATAGAMVIGTSGSYIGAGAIQILPYNPGPGGNCVTDLDILLGGGGTGEQEDEVRRFTVNGAFGAVGL